MLEPEKSFQEIVRQFNQTASTGPDGADRMAELLDEYGPVVNREIKVLQGNLVAEGLSGREATVVALKAKGFTHEAIADMVTWNSEEAVSTSSIDEYSRRARRKYHKAKGLVQLIEDSGMLEKHPNWG